jgi:hypothetical protein
MMHLARTLALTLLPLALAGGCSSGDDDDDERPPNACDQVAQSICEANATCAIEQGAIVQADRRGFVSSCIIGFYTRVDCSKAMVIGQPDVCEADVAATPCAQFALPNGLPLPASCMGIFQ